METDEITEAMRSAALAAFHEVSAREYHTPAMVVEAVLAAAITAARNEKQAGSGDPL